MIVYLLCVNTEDRGVDIVSAWYTRAQAEEAKRTISPLLVGEDLFIQEQTVRGL